jgi:hypothetical protein
VVLLHQFFAQDANAISLTGQDFAVLDAYRALGPRPACAADVFLFIRNSLGRDPRLPTIFKIVTRLRARGLLEERGEGLAPEGGRPRRLYRLTPVGRSALALAESMSAQGGHAGEACTA